MKPDRRFLIGSLAVILALGGVLVWAIANCGS